MWAQTYSFPAPPTCVGSRLGESALVHPRTGPSPLLASRAVIIAVVSAKGGTGKTTISVSIASSSSPSLLVDADPAASSSAWARMAEDVGMPLTPQVVGLPTRELRRRLAGLGTFPLVVIDTPPGDPGIITGALEVADIALVPAKPSIVDISRVWPALEMATAAGVPAMVVLSQVRARTLLAEVARVALREGGAHLAKTEIPARESVAGAYGGPLPNLLIELGGELLREARAMVRKGTR